MTGAKLERSSSRAYNNPHGQDRSSFPHPTQPEAPRGYLVMISSSILIYYSRELSDLQPGNRIALLRDPLLGTL